MCIRFKFKLHNCALEYLNVYFDGAPIFNLVKFSSLPELNDIKIFVASKFSNTFKIIINRKKAVKKTLPMKIFGSQY